ncbi:MAG: hypothetical protein GDA68_01530 [Nitrospira sp. CR2.1]|nr:hypothetical protein [Nitrospira sp. CR2.1]
MNGQELPLRPGQYVRLTVSDIGNDMGGPDHLRKLGPLFAHLPAGTQTGAELGTAQQIVSEQGGTLRATSSVGHGTTIEVYLPAIVPPGTIVAAEQGPNRASHLAEQRESLAERDKER